ncbi:MAG: metallophosphoesterase [Candidatus Aminicenantales bacterium]
MKPPQRPRDSFRRRRERTLSALILVFLIGLIFIPAAYPAAIPCAWKGVNRIVAVGDLHGDYDDFVKILLGTGMVNQDLAWAGGTAHFVQTGDILDRGSDARKIFDLLMRLEKEAAAAGGMVHVLLGNHEEMTLTGIVFDYPDYVTVGQFISFLPPSYRNKKEKELRKSLDGSAVEKAREFWQSVMRTATGRRQYIEGFHSLYGAWLLRKNAVIRINDTIFVHGGISEKYSSWKIETINALLRKELGIFVERHRMFPTGRLPFVPRIVYDPSGPLWFREHALQDDEAVRGEFNRVMKDLGARHMVIAHTFYRADGLSPLVAPAYMSRFEGRLWIIDTGISEAFGGVNSALIIDGDEFGLWSDAGEIEAAPAPGAGKTPATDVLEAGEEDLKTARIDTIVRGTERGRTEPWTIVLDGSDGVRRAVFRYVDRRRPSPLPDSWRYEMAAYELDKLIGLGIVPATVEREVAGLEGSLQAYVEGSLSETDRRRQDLRIPDPGAFEERLASIRAFALLVNDGCENLDDTFIERNSGRIFRVDFSEAFGPSSALSPQCNVSSCPESLAGKLRGIDRDLLDRTLSRFLNKEELDALARRKDLLIRLLEESK